MNLATYLRMSTEQQQDSPETQRLILTEWATRHGHTIVAEYLDEALSGGLPAKERPAAARLLMDAGEKHRPFDAILIIRLDRLARDAEDRIGILRYLEKHHCAVWTPEGQERMDTPTAGLLQRITAAVDQYERELTGMRIREHNLARAMQGKPSGRTTLGVSWDNTAGVMCATDRLPDVVHLYRWFVENGGNVVDVCRKATAAGIRSLKGKALTPTAMRKILKAPVYRREVSYGGQRLDASATIPAFIPAELVQSVDAIFAAGRTIPSRSKGSPAAYSGRLQCGLCGQSVYQTSSTAKKGGKTSWVCAGRWNGTCQSQSMSTLLLNRLVGQALTDVFASLTAPELTKWDYPDGDASIARRREALQSQRARLGELYLDGMITREKMNRRRDAIDAELAELRQAHEVTPSIIDRDSVLLMAATVGAQWGDVPATEQRAILDALQVRIMLYSYRDKPRQIDLHTATGAPPVTVTFSCRNRHKKRQRTAEMPQDNE